MGKTEEEHNLPSTTPDAQGTSQSSGNNHGRCFGCRKLKKVVSLRCVAILVLSLGVFLSTVFWLPFSHFGHKKDLDLDYYAGHDIVASFMLKKPASFLKDYIMQLENGIFDEMSYASTKVEVIAIESSTGSNVTKVVFAVEADITTQSLIRSLFVDLITHRTYLQLTSSLFGEPFLFDVLKFKGGISVSPDQKAFLMQNDQILFNFTLQFSVDQILNNFNELRSQLKTGLHLTPYEILYIRLTNLKGSTVAPPTTVQSQVLLAVGIDPSKRLKQLAQTVGSHSKNLGLNDTVFGKVKQVRLSTILQHSLNNDGHGPSPAPSPYSSPESQYHRHHHHHHHRHHIADSPTPTISPSPSIRKSHGPLNRKSSHIPTPVPAPSPGNNNRVFAPPPCHLRFPWKFHNEHSHLAPSKPPLHAPIVSPPLRPKRVKTPTLIPTPKLSRVPPVSSPSASLCSSHSQPPSRGQSHNGQVLPMVSAPSQSTSSAGIFSPGAWALLPLLLTILLL